MSGIPPKTNNTLTITQEEYDKLQEAAGRYAMIAKDPQISQQVLDHFKARSGTISRGSPRQTNMPQSQENNTTQNNPQTEEMRQMYARQAQLEVELFQMRNPDMKDYQQNMAELIRKYPDMTLQDAYTFSKNAKPQPTEQQKKETTATPTTETNNAAGIEETSEVSKQQIQQKIEDRKATPRIEDAIDLAWQAAKEQHEEAEA